ncbi:hypothetical protein [Mesorhizobium sp.]|uniref:hypothetical protein n=1 Tax=Mesorhizobium sp. TaxID=1871066 RepID=UPI000FE31CD0|nr:hypothetical protein [Mesorhizobium sp.]RWN59378.1 MAG: hypothetical protein EOR98_03105 [Mesorhizobium sp.]RWN80884.1 MAG: hypothetical protein EOS02_03100 [Mesorhizobium sp.]RWN83329.1 MAG: hypothetical protein EOS01_03240 [Mesorhizobium sp.]RWN86767.1 MAG: hypothetical protein EOS04_17880 [Mesorhizobium sp.]RWO16402.1 MAG: hypothetical protein EOS15_05275 [Mesorhizobium sp.]
MDTQTISAFAAAAAATAATAVAGIQLFIGLRSTKAALVSSQAAMINATNAGSHRIAASRQKWIDDVIDTLSEYHALLMAQENGSVPPDDRMKISALRTKLEILLNPDERDTVELLDATDGVIRAATPEERTAKSAELVKVARRLLKREWVRIKTDLERD